MEKAVRFQKNIEYYARTTPEVALKLPYVEYSPLPHSPKKTLKEARDWFAHLDLEGIEILYVYGVGFGYAHDAALKWLKKSKKHQLVFLEDDPKVLCRLFETEKGTALLKSKQVQLIFLHNNEQDPPTFERLSWYYLQQPIKVTAQKQYAKEKKEALAILQHKLHYDAAGKFEIIDEYLNFGVPFYRSFYPNLLLLPQSYSGNALYGKFPQEPAIICGAGPSLLKQLPLLKTLRDRALIFSGGSSLNALNHAGILPHFGVGIDPNEEQFKRISANTGFEVPFFYRNRMNHHALMTVHGPRLYLTGSGGYDTADWFEEQLGIKGQDLDEGHNVINLCVEIAHALGCNPIILIGMDLAYTERKAYAPGVVKDPRMQKKTLEESALLRKDIHGKDVYTQWKWVAESQWIGDYATEHSDVTLINATEGGLGFPNVPNMTLKHVKQKYLSKTRDLCGQVHGEIQNSPLGPLTREKVKEEMLKLKQSLEKCLTYLDQLIEHADLPLVEMEITEEPAYKGVLAIFNTIYEHVQYRQMQAAKTTKRKHALDVKRYLFLKKTALVNLHLLKEALHERSADTLS